MHIQCCQELDKSVSRVGFVSRPDPTQKSGIGNFFGIKMTSDREVGKKVGMGILSGREVGNVGINKISFISFSTKIRGIFDAGI